MIVVIVVVAGSALEQSKAHGARAAWHGLALLS
jgi:hypothetical protein